MANTPDLFRNGAVGFIDCLDLVVSFKSFCDAFCQLFHLLHVLNMTLPFFSQQLRCGACRRNRKYTIPINKSIGRRPTSVPTMFSFCASAASKVTKEGIVIQLKGSRSNPA